MENKKYISTNTGEVFGSVGDALDEACSLFVGCQDCPFDRRNNDFWDGNDGCSDAGLRTDLYAVEYILSSEFHIVPLGSGYRDPDPDGQFSSDEFLFILTDL